MLDIARVVVPLHFYDPPTAVAVVWAESRGVTTAVGVVSALKPSGQPEPWHGSRDRGTWQFNSYFHPEVSDLCVFDLACSAREAFRVSTGGRAWRGVGVSVRNAMTMGRDACTHVVLARGL